jgi:hypothetical protein
LPREDGAKAKTKSRRRKPEKNTLLRPKVPATGAVVGMDERTKCQLQRKPKIPPDRRSLKPAKVESKNSPETILKEYEDEVQRCDHVISEIRTTIETRVKMNFRFKVNVTVLYYFRLQWAAPPI